MKSWIASLRAIQRCPDPGEVPDPDRSGSGLSNTTWLTPAFAGYRGNKALSGQKPALFGQKPALAITLVPVYSRYSRYSCIPGIPVFPATLYLWSFLIAFGLEARVARCRGIHGEYTEYTGIRPYGPL